jgi:acetylornithine deacetylase/succinyl-diaminopimelate desuccinylase-like protein
LKDIEVGGGPGDPEIDPGWGEPGLSPAERVIGWNTFEVLAFTTGNTANPVHAIPAEARADCHMRYVVGSDVANFLTHIRAHLDAQGFDDVELRATGGRMAATRLDPDDAWVRWGLASMERSTGKRPALLPNLGGSLPNEVFSETLGLPTLWVPHSYAACSQHAPNEHILDDLTREALQLMAGLFWDLAEEGPRVMTERIRT